MNNLFKYLERLFFSMHTSGVRLFLFLDLFDVVEFWRNEYNRNQHGRAFMFEENEMDING